MAFLYKPTATGLALHNSSKYLKILVGPYGSGKSCACAMDVFINAAAQAPASDGVRYSRVGVIRSSYPELVSATRKSLLEVLPGECGSILASGSPMRGFYMIPLPDGTKIQLELDLWALQTEDDAEKVKSANWSFVWINEATGCAPAVYAQITSRIGRFPPKSLGGCSWAGVIMDFNQPMPGSWLDDFMENPQPDWDVFKQPPAAFKRIDEQGNLHYDINPDAENLENLGSEQDKDPANPLAAGLKFYQRQIESNIKLGRYDIIDNQYCLLPVAIVDGKPVFPEFKRERHVAKVELKPVPHKEIIVGMDQSGIHPAAVIAQEQNGQWYVLDELFMDGEGFESFLLGGLIPLLRSKYPDNPIYCVIDPSNQKDSWQGITPKERLAEFGIQAVTEITNSPKARIQCVSHMLNLYSGGLLVSPVCAMLVRGFESEYRYRRLRAVGTTGAVYAPQPEKNEYSHCMDALQYICLFILSGMIQNDNAKYNELLDKVQQTRRQLARIV